MAEATLSVDVVTPEKLAYSADKAVLVSAPATLGRVGILPGHAPLVSTLEKGELHIRENDGREVRMETGPGFLQVKQNKVIILVEKIQAIS